MVRSRFTDDSVHMSSSLQLGPSVVPFYLFFGGEGSPTKIDCRKKGWYPYSILSNLEDLDKGRGDQSRSFDVPVPFLKNCP